MAYICKDGKKIAVLTHEFLSPEATAAPQEQGKRVHIVYTAHDGVVDYSKGYIVEGGTVSWTYDDKVTGYQLQSGSPQTIYLDRKGQISATHVTDATEAEIKPILVVDRRGDEMRTYPIVKIAHRFWFKTNLAAQRYTDGTPIPKYTTQEEWKKLETPACAIFHNEAKPDADHNLRTYGVLYNFHAATSPKIAPKDWQVPTDQTFGAMVAYIDRRTYQPDAPNGQESPTAGTYLKKTDGWRTQMLPTTGAEPSPGNDLSGFSVIGSGSTSDSRYFEFSGEEKQAYFWTATVYEEKKAMMRRLFWDSPVSNRFFSDMHMGYSLRLCTPLQTYDKVDKVDDTAGITTAQQSSIITVSDQQVTIHTDRPTAIRLITTDGRILLRQTVDTTTTLPLNNGVTIIQVTIDGKKYIRKITVAH